jgi:hypothetical protein
MRLVEQLNGVLATRDTRGADCTVADASFSGRNFAEGGEPDWASGSDPAPYSDIQIVVEGSSDSAANDSQATRRADSVRRALVANGMPANRASVRGLGDSHAGQLEFGREQNRRVEIVISGDRSAPSFWDRTYSLMTRRP